MPGTAQPSASMNSGSGMPGGDLGMQQMMQQQQPYQVPQQQQQMQQQAVSSQMLGQKRPLNGMDPAAAAAMPQNGPLPSGMVPQGPPSGSMMGMQPQQQYQQQQYQQQQYQQQPYQQSYQQQQPQQYPQQQYQQQAASYGAPGMQGMIPVNNGMDEHTSAKRVKQEGQQLLGKVGIYSCRWFVRRLMAVLCTLFSVFPDLHRC